MRSRKTPNGSIDTGFADSVAVIMATPSYRETTKMYWDRTREDSRPAAFALTIDRGLSRGW